MLSFIHRHQKHFLVCFLLVISYSLTAQNVEDTIYFDEDWSICEKPVAAYYRTSTLHRVNNIFYTGQTRDYFINGVLEMAGQYDKNGLKQGEFEFYNHQGKIVKGGTYVDDVMNGEWSYFDESENLKAKFYCETGTDFTPILIITNNGDTLVKEGTGKFSFDTQKDLPHVFPPSSVYQIQGEVVTGLKEGMYTYTNLFNNKEFKRTEIYQDGIFRRGKDYSVATGSVKVDKPFSFLDLSDKNLEKVDNFYHSNIVFGLGKEGEKKVINFLLNQTEPEIKSLSNSFEENDKDIFIILGEVFRKYLKLLNAQHVNFSYPPGHKQCNLLSFYLPDESNNSVPDIHCSAVFTIDTSGYVIQSAFEGNLPKSQIDKINYYLSRLTGLAPYEQEGEKTLSNIKINISTYRDTVRNANNVMGINYYFTAFNASYEDSSIDYIFKDSTVQIESKFPGGRQKYIERNLLEYCDRQ